MKDFEFVFSQLRGIMLDAAGDQVIDRDDPGNLIVRTRTLDPKTGQPGWFGTVTVKKSYVAYHLIPLYADPTLAAGLSAPLAKRKQGKTCFNFKSVDPQLFGELAELTNAARLTVE